MPRNSSGVYTLPEAAFVAGTTIQSSPVNSNYSDIASTLTLSLATTGVSTMTGPIKAASGSVTAPSYTFGSATGTGFYLSGANAISWTAAGVLAATFAADGSVTWVGTQTFSSATFTSATFTSGIRVGFSGAPTADRAEVGDATFYMDGSNSALPLIAFDSNDFMSYTRASNTYDFNIGGATIFQVDDTFTKSNKNFIIDSDTIILATAGYVDQIEIAAPSAPNANTARLYTKDLAGATILAYQDSAATETILTPPARAYAEYTTNATLSGSIPQDNTIPQSGEGDQIVTASITLKKSNSRVRVTFQGWVSRDAEDTNHVTAVFSDLSANALNVTMVGNSNDTGTTRTQMIFLQVEHAPATVGPITYQIRCGTNGGNYAFSTFPTSTAIFGGASKATLVVEEIYV